MIYLTIKEAREILTKKGIRVTEKTIRIWAKEHGIGRKVGGRYVIFHDSLNKFICGTD